MNKEILKRYFEGKSSKWEKKQVREYFRGDDMRVFDEYIREQERDTSGGFSDPDDVYKKDFYAELMGRIEEKEAPAEKKRSNLPLVFKIAASILLFTGFGGAFYVMQQHRTEIARQPLVETLTNSGKNLKKILLPDGTTIWMNPGSVLKYDKKHFGDTTREVMLAGEAYFDVAHHAEKPFKVHSGRLTTRVLGTAFNIEAYQGEEKIRILLVRGKVQVTSDRAQNALTPGHMLEYNLPNDNISISAVDVAGLQEQITSGKLVFENVSLRHVFSRLEEVFGITITLTDPAILTGKTISGAWYRDHAEETLQRILFIHGLKLKKKGEKHYVVTD